MRKLRSRYGLRALPKSTFFLNIYVHGRSIKKHDIQIITLRRSGKVIGQNEACSFRLSLSPHLSGLSSDPSRQSQTPSQTWKEREKKVKILPVFSMFRSFLGRCVHLVVGGAPSPVGAGELRRPAPGRNRTPGLVLAAGAVPAAVADAGKTL